MGQLVGVAQEPGCNILHDLYLSHLSFIFCTNLENSNLACTLNTFFCISFSCVTAVLHTILPAVVNVDLTVYIRIKSSLGYTCDS